MSILSVRKKYRLVNRVRAVVRIIIKHGLGYFIDRIFREPYLKILRLHHLSSRDRKQIPPAQRLRLMIEELGPTYIKIGQFFSTRADILPENFLKELEKLQDSVSPFSFDEVKKTIYEDFGKNLDEIFLEFSEKPLFAASIGQVHVAKLVSGESCVVKVRRPLIEDIVQSDIEVLTEIFRIASKHIPELKQWNIPALLEEIGEYLKRQMDFVYEAGMMEKLGKFYGKSDIIVPAVVWQYTSKRVLTMQKLNGKKILDVSNSIPDIPEKLVKGLFHTLFETGYFHGDLHPGNIMLMEDGRIALVDFGLVGYLSFEKRKLLAGIISGILGGKISDTIPHLKKFFGLSHNVPENFEKDVGFIVDRYGSLPLGKIHLADIIYDVMKIARKMSITLDPDIGLLAKNLMSLEGICASINPSESLLQLSKSYWESLLSRGLFQHLWIEEFKNVFLSYRNLVFQLPENIDEFVRINKERIETEQEIVRRLDRYTRSLENAGTKISFSIIILPAVSVLILFGLRNLSLWLFLVLLAGLFVFVAVLFRLLTGRDNA